MQSNIYVGLSAQLALQRRLDTVANNVANASTAGFRAEEMSFEELLSRKRQGRRQLRFEGPKPSFDSRRASLTQTDNPLDIAVRGDAWLAIQTPTGTVYTRDGRMQMRHDGVLTNLCGRSLPRCRRLADPARSREAGRRRSTRPARSSRTATTSALSDFIVMPQQAQADACARALPSSPIRQPVPEIDFLRTASCRAIVEKSNVNPILEMTHLTTLQRSFDAVSNVLRETELSLQDSLKTLAGS